MCERERGGRKEGGRREERERDAGFIYFKVK